MAAYGSLEAVVQADTFSGEAVYYPAGASVCLPGGRFALATLKKELHLYGVGYYYPGDPNQRTIIDAFHLGEGSDNSSISGMYFTQHVMAVKLVGDIV